MQGSKVFYNNLTLLSVSSEPGSRNWLIYAYTAQQAKVLTGLEPKSPFLHKTPLWQSYGGAVRFVDLAGVAGENPGRLELSGSTVKIKSKIRTAWSHEPSHNPCQGTDSPWCRGHSWLRKNHEMPQPGGWIPPCSGISRELGRTLPTAGFCNGHSSHIAQTTAGAAAWGRRPQENEIRPTRAASETHEECGFLLRSWMSPTEHFPWLSSQILKQVHFGCACASFVFIFHGHPSRDLHPRTSAESGFKAWWLEYSHTDN